MEELDAVEELLRLRRNRPSWNADAFRDLEDTVNCGYWLQDALHAALEREGVHRSGYKVGSTSAAGQRQFGIIEPVFAGIFETTRYPSIAHALAAPLRAPMLEFEIAVTLGGPLSGASPSDSEIADVVGSCWLACEIVDDRYGAEKKLPALLGDDFFHAGFVIGPAISHVPIGRLGDLSVELTVDDAVSRGRSSDVLSPLASLRWLSGALARQGRGLSAGDTVLTGSLIPPLPVQLPASSLSVVVAGVAHMDLHTRSGSES